MTGLGMALDAFSCGIQEQEYGDGACGDCGCGHQSCWAVSGASPTDFSMHSAIDYDSGHQDSTEFWHPRFLDADGGSAQLDEALPAEVSWPTCARQDRGENGDEVWGKDLAQDLAQDLGSPSEDRYDAFDFQFVDPDIGQEGGEITQEGDKGEDFGQTVMAPAPVSLPKTSFPMRGNLPDQEPKWITWWQDVQLYDRLGRRRSGQGASRFVLHDGPPYANGAIHMGHGMNKILKDFMVRWRSKTHWVDFRPGWDCHGLPIETQIEKDLSGQGRQRQDVPIPDFRARCRDFADRWVQVQKEGFVRLGILADWDRPYRTMDHDFTAGIIKSFFALLTQGHVYRGVRPVLWSASEQTALAEAEIDYQDVTSTAIYVRFALQGALPSGWDGANVVIWTTTPWSLPGNRAVAYMPQGQYGLYEVQQVHEGSLARVGERLVLATSRFDAVAEAAGIAQAALVDVVSGQALSGLVARHPWASHSPVYGFSVPLIPGEFVTDDAGTGMVHIAPCHGMDDFILGQQQGLEVATPLSKDGVFESWVPGLAGLAMQSCYPSVRQMLMDQGRLLAEHPYTHSYPHSWRSKKPLFYRATPQWFIALDGPLGLRQKALDCLNDVAFYPESAATRMRATLARRPDWCISRQRVWGVPIAVFVHKDTGQVLQDPQVFERIYQRVLREGADFWFTDQAQEVLDGLYDPQEWIKGEDIIDVWFESGVTHQVVLAANGALAPGGSGGPWALGPSGFDFLVEQNLCANGSQVQERLGQRGQATPGQVSQVPDSLWPADVNLEGSDQHRAWFQSSLLTACALQGRAPYKALVTHGFCLDQRGRKMSKSLGNVVDPSDVVQRLGADVLRLWVAYEDYHQDVRVGKEILDRAQDLYRRFRNTLRFLLGALDELTPQELRPVDELHVLDRWVLSRLRTLDVQVRTAYDAYDFRTVVDLLHHFCAVDLSSFYLHACKDALYCEPKNSPRRAGVRTTLLWAFGILVDWLSPILPFTTEEAWACFGVDCVGLRDVRGPLQGQTLQDQASQDRGLPAMAACLIQMGLLDQDQLPDVWSVHLRTVTEAISRVAARWQWDDTGLVDKARQVRSAVTGVLEQARARKDIADSLQAAPSVFLTPDFAGLTGELLAEVCVTSGMEIGWIAGRQDLPSQAVCVVVGSADRAGSSGAPRQDLYQALEGPLDQHGPTLVGQGTSEEIVGVVMGLASGEKCHRCWRVLPPAAYVPEPLCARCAEVSRGI